MIAIVTVLLALPLGWAVRRREWAHVWFTLAYLWAFCFQGVYLVLQFVDGDRSAFRADAFPWDYGAFALVVLAVGHGLVRAGAWLRGRHDARATASGRVAA